MTFGFKQFRAICSMIKIEHSIFALPYAWAGAVLAARGTPPLLELLLLTIAMVAVRSFAMTVNRIADLDFDRENPRTNKRPLVTGAITVREAKFFCIIMAIIFVGACALLNMVCLILAIPALIFAGAYSFLKRFTPYCHFWLGATLGLAPLAGWLSVNPDSLGLSAIMLFLAVTFWVGAFDIYYAFQDMEIDKEAGLESIPAHFGPDISMAIAAFSHVMTVVFLLLAGISGALGWPWYILCAIIAVILYYEHRLVSPEDLSNINMAFFTFNGIISPVVLLGIILGVYF